VADVPAELTMLAGNLIEACVSVARVADRDVKAEGLAVTRSQLAVLRFLIDHGASAMLDLAGGIGVTGPTMTSTVRILVRKGLVERKHHEVDWRTVLVSATEKGVSAHDLALRSRSQLVASAIQGLTTDQRAVLTLAAPALRALGARVS